MQVKEQARVEQDPLHVELNPGLQEKHPARSRPTDLAPYRVVGGLQVDRRAGDLTLDARTDAGRKAHLAPAVKAQLGTHDPVRDPDSLRLRRAELRVVAADLTEHLEGNDAPELPAHLDRHGSATEALSRGRGGRSAAK